MIAQHGSYWLCGFVHHGHVIDPYPIAKTEQFRRSGYLFNQNPRPYAAPT